MINKFTGHVFNRKDNSPICGVTVSDGKNITVTDENGAFVLEGWERARIIHVGVLTCRHNDWYSNIENSKAEYNFYIDRCDVSNKDFCFLHTSDTEIENRYDNAWVEFLKKSVIDTSPAFFMHTGDLCREDGVKRHYLAMNRETVGCPVRYCIGNHDFIGEVYGEEIYEKLYGPCWYSFDCGNIHFAILSIGVGDNPSGYAHEDQWEWLLNDLAHMDKSKKLIICCHDLCASDPEGFTKTLKDKTINLRDEGLIAWVYGHYHINLAHNYNGVLNLCVSRPDSGGIDSSPACVRRISIEDLTVTSDVIYNAPADAAKPTDFLWETKIDGKVEFTDTLMSGRKIFIATSDDNYPKKCGIYAIDSENGDVLSFYPTKGGIKGGIAIDNNRIYAQDSYGSLYCLNADTFELIWEAKSTMPRSGYTTMGVTLADDLVISGAHYHPFAYNKNDGTLIWDMLLPKCEETPAKTIFDSKRKRLYFSLHWRSLICVDLYSGEILWENTDRHQCWFRSSTPLLCDDKIYLGGLYTVAKLDAETGKTLLSLPIKGRMDVCGAPALDGDFLYYPTADKGVFKVHKKTLETVMIYPAGKANLFSSPYIYGNAQMVESSPVIHNDKLIFTASDGCVYIYDKESGKLINSITCCEPSIVAPIICNDKIYVAGYNGTVKAFYNIQNT